MTRFVPFCRSACLLAALVLLLGGCKGLQLDRSRVVSEADWLTEGDSPRRAQATTTPIAPPLEEVWVYNAGAGFGPGSPLILGETVIASTRKGEVHAVDVESGRRVGFDSFGDAVEGTPLIEGGILFVPVALGRRSLVAYDLQRASTRWSKRGASVEVGLLPLGESLAAVDTDAMLRVYAQDDGTQRWEHALGDDVQVKATPVLADGKIVVVNDRGEVAAFQPDDGQVAWTQTLDAPVYTTPATADDLLFFPTTRGRLHVLDAREGTPRWQFTLPDTTVRFTAPSVEGSQVVVGATDGRLRAFDVQSGEQLWTFEVDGAISGAPLLTPDYVFFGTMREKLYAVDRQTGTLEWEHELRGRMKSAMATREGRLVVLTEPRYVYLFESTEAGDYAVSE